MGRGGGQSWGPEPCLLVGLGDTRALGTAPGCDACGGAAAERLRGAGSEGASAVLGGVDGVMEHVWQGTTGPTGQVTVLCRGGAWRRPGGAGRAGAGVGCAHQGSTRQLGGADGGLRWSPAAAEDEAGSSA